MNLFHIFCELKDRSKAAEFAEDVQGFLSYLYEREYIESYRILRRRFGFTPQTVGEFHVMIECKDLEQMERAFEFVSAQSEEVIAFSRPVYEAVKDLTMSLYEDFPEAKRPSHLS
jgi:hypothetical protein